MGTEDRLGGKKTLKVMGVLEDIEKDEVKKRVDIISLFAAFGVSLVPKGKGYMGRCPWHEDSTPSLSVDAKKGLYNCFGCGESGDTVTLVEKMKGYSFREAIAYLKKESLSAAFTPEATGQQPKVTSEQPQAEEQPLTSTPPGLISLREVNDYYQKRLLASEEARAYLKKRGLDNLPLLFRLGVGYADDSLLAKLTEAQKEHLKTLGMVNEHGYEHFNGCLTVPLYDEAGELVEMYGRKLSDNGAFKHLYSSGGHKGLCNGKATKAYEEVILSESIFDALSLIHLGIENVLPLYGTSGFTPAHLQALKTNSVKTVILALDNDEPGRNASEKLKTELLTEGFALKVTFPPKFKDWNEELTSGLNKERVVSLLETAPLFETPPAVEKLTAKKEGELYLFSTGGLKYKLRGVNESFVTSLKVFMRTESAAGQFSDNVDLCSYRSRLHYAELVAQRFKAGEAACIEGHLSRMLDYLEAERDKFFAAASGKTEYRLSEEERKLGEEFLNDPKLFDQILSDMEALGCAGEEENKLLVYLAAVSRLLEKPISIYVQSASGMGKSFLLETLRKLLPEESVKVFTSFSDQSLNYLPEEFFTDRVFMIGEAIHNEVVEAQVRQMQSENELSRLVTLKDPKTGELKSQELRHKVRLSFMMSSTTLTLNPENASRCLVLHVDESEEQDERISRMQLYRQTPEGQAKEKSLTPQIIKKHQSALRILEKLEVFGPLAPAIRYPRLKQARRRSQGHFLTLLKAVALLRQRQKPQVKRRDEYSGEEVSGIEWDREDFQLASRLFNCSVLKHCELELNAQAVALYSTILSLARERAKTEGLRVTELSFIQREVRELSTLGSDSVKRYLRLLVEREYLEVLGGKSHGTRFSYRLREDAPIGERELRVSIDEVEVKRLEGNPEPMGLF